MKVDPLCRTCQKSCKQVKPAMVISCTKFIPKKKSEAKNKLCAAQ